MLNNNTTQKYQKKYWTKILDINAERWERNIK